MKNYRCNSKSENEKGAGVRKFRIKAKAHVSLLHTPLNLKAPEGHQLSRIVFILNIRP
jgi:hypothetical protein